MECSSQYAFNSLLVKYVAWSVKRMLGGGNDVMISSKRSQIAFVLISLSALMNINFEKVSIMVRK